MTRLARRQLLRAVAGIVIGVALNACGGSSAARTVPVPQRSVVDTTSFATSLDVDLSKFTRTPSGVYYRDVARGTGAIVALDRTLTLKYVLSLPSGTVVEVVSTPSDVVLSNDVIRGWRDGLSGMRAGGSRTIIVPPELGYGNRAHGTIPPRSTLVFEIELLNVR